MMQVRLTLLNDNDNLYQYKLCSLIIEVVCFENIGKKIETFLVLAQCRSFMETAKRLYCSQPTISNHIQQLEEQFQCKLFHRSGKKTSN